MSGALFLIAAIAISEENERNEKILLNNALQNTKDNNYLYLSNRAPLIKTDEDFFAFYQEILERKHSYYSPEKSSYHSIGISDFFAFLSIAQDPKQTARLIKKGNLMMKTLQYRRSLLKEFIAATGTGAPFRGTKEHQYFVERDIFQNRLEIISAFTAKQSKPNCWYTWDESDSFSFKELFDQTKISVSSLLKALIQTDIQIPAFLIAKKDKKMLNTYLTILKTKTFTYTPDLKAIHTMMEKAKVEALKPEYQQEFIPPCPAAKKKWFIVPWLDKKNSYECPLAARTIQKMRDS